jgi:rod shape-determining protein MreC
MFVVVAALLNIPAPDALRIRSGVQDSLAPFQNFMSVLVYRVRETAAAFASGRSRSEEKRELLGRIALLEHQLHQSRGLQRENARLLAYLGSTNNYGTAMVFCEIIARGDATGWWQTVTVNRGYRDGIRPGLAVVGEKGLVGKTARVSWRTAEVLLLTDPNCKVPCRTAGRGSFGILEGRGLSATGRQRMEMLAAVNPIRMDYVPLDAPLQEGDILETSGLGRILPPGIPIGRLAATGMDSSGLFQHADVVPFADLSSIRYLFVLMSPVAGKGDGSR